MCGNHLIICLSIKKAYEVLIDPQKRQRYDQFGHQSWTSSSSQTQTEDIYSESFKDIFKKNQSSFNKNFDKELKNIFKKDFNKNQDPCKKMF